MRKVFQKAAESFFSFLDRLYDEKAISDLEALCNDDNRMEEWARPEPEWQPYPLIEPREDETQC